MAGARSSQRGGTRPAIPERTGTASQQSCPGSPRTLRHLVEWSDDESTTRKTNPRSAADPPDVHVTRRPGRRSTPASSIYRNSSPPCARSATTAGSRRVRAYHATESYAKAMRKRQVWVESLFAEAKDWHGLRRFRLRGREQVNREALLIAAGQNLKRLLSRHGWGRRPFPSGATGVVLPALASCRP
jgi:hypothetical protein